MYWIISGVQILEGDFECVSSVTDSYFSSIV